MKRNALGPIAIVGCILSLGCADTKGPTSRPATFRERQDAALNDPFEYHPDVPGAGKGSGLTEFDKDGFNQDMKRVFNP